MSGKQMKILLAIDPFEKKFKPSRAALIDLHQWVKRFAGRVEAVYVLSESDQDPRFNQTYTHAYDQLKKVVDDLHFGIPVPTKVIWDNKRDSHHASNALLEHAKLMGADLILVSSRGRKWMSRMVLGSFAENLMLKSPVPILFFGLAPILHSGFHRVMFPTDFSPASKIAFKQFLNQVKAFDPDLLILNVEQYPGIISGYSLTGVGAYLPEVYWKIQKEASISEGEAWVDEAARAGVRARFLVEECGTEVASIIKRVADQESIALIGLASVRTELDRLIMGSVSTQLFRSSKYSVWVFGPHAFEVSKQINQIEKQHPSEMSS